MLQWWNCCESFALCVGENSEFTRGVLFDICERENWVICNSSWCRSFFWILSPVLFLVSDLNRSCSTWHTFTALHRSVAWIHSSFRQIKSFMKAFAIFILCDFRKSDGQLHLSRSGYEFAWNGREFFILLYWFMELRCDWIEMNWTLTSFH